MGITNCLFYFSVRPIPPINKMALHSALTTLLVFLVLLQTIVAAQQTCLPGTFRTGRKCRPCLLGTISTQSNARSFYPCQEGTFQPLQSASYCIPCPTDTATDKTASTRCNPCPPNSNSRSNSPTCSFCPKGQQNRSNPRFGCINCLPASLLTSPATRTCCKLCPDGRDSKNRASKCDICPPGSAKRNFPNIISECRKCLPGTFNNVAGARDCQLCRPGTTAKRGATQCTICAKNTFSHRIPVTNYRPCPNGSFTLGKGSAACKHPGRGCPYNTFEDKNGICQVCMPGERLDTTNKQCVPCNRNQVSKGGVDTRCETCPSPKIPVGPDNFRQRSRCTCPPGTVDDGTSPGCLPRPPGTFWNNPNQFIFGTDVVRCQTCPLGTFTSKPGSLSCQACPSGTFADKEGSARCSKCPPGSRTKGTDLEFDLSRCIVDKTGCRPGQIRNEDGRCQTVSCPSKNYVMFEERCEVCGFDFKATKRNGCVRCAKDETNLGGAVKACTKFPKGRRGGSGDCRCPLFYAEVNGKCVENCPRGLGDTSFATASIGGDIIGICKKCPPSIISESGFCNSCGRKTIAKDGIECVRWKGGQVVASDVSDARIDECVDPYGAV